MKIVDKTYPELMDLLGKATEENEHQKTFDYSVALVRKPHYHHLHDKKWMMEHQVKEIDEIITEIDENRPDRDILIVQLNEVKDLILQRIEEIKKELKTFR